MLACVDLDLAFLGFAFWVHSLQCRTTILFLNFANNFSQFNLSCNVCPQYNKGIAHTG